MRTETYIDKSAWGAGPWLDEPDRLEWRDPATGLDYVKAQCANLAQQLMEAAP